MEDFAFGPGATRGRKAGAAASGDEKRQQNQHRFSPCSSDRTHVPMHILVGHFLKQIHCSFGANITAERKEEEKDGFNEAGNSGSGRRMKGIEFSVLILFWLIAVGMVVTASWGLPFMSGNRQEALVKTEVYMMGSALDAAGTYMAAALQFSNYQSCYEIMKSGEALPAREDFIALLELDVSGNMNKYAAMGYNFAKRYAVSMPKYDVSVAEGAGGLVADAKADGNMISRSDVLGTKLGDKEERYSFKGEVSVLKDANIRARLRLNCLSLFDRAKRKSDELSGKMLELIDAELDGLQRGTYVSSIEQCDGSDKAMAESRIKGAISRLSDGTAKVEPVEVSLGAMLHTPVEKGADGRIRCFFERTGESKATAKVVMKSVEKAPVWDGNAISYEDIDMGFLSAAKAAVLQIGL